MERGKRPVGRSSVLLENQERNLRRVYMVGRRVWWAVTEVEQEPTDGLGKDHCLPLLPSLSLFVPTPQGRFCITKKYIVIMPRQTGLNKHKYRTEKHLFL